MPGGTPRYYALSAAIETLFLAIDAGWQGHIQVSLVSAPQSQTNKRPQRRTQTTTEGDLASTSASVSRATGSLLRDQIIDGARRHDQIRKFIKHGTITFKSFLLVFWSGVLVVGPRFFKRIP